MSFYDSLHSKVLFVKKFNGLLIYADLITNLIFNCFRWFIYLRNKVNPLSKTSNNNNITLFHSSHDI